MPDKRSVELRPSVSYLCLHDLLEHQAKRIPDAPAILALERAPLTYGRLYQHIDEMGGRLRSMGIGGHDRVAVVLPNGPEMAVAILTVSSSAVCAPMNPAYAADELDRYFADLRPRALITQAGIDSSARRVALSRGIRVIELSSACDAEAGLFTLMSEQGVEWAHETTSPDDVALLLFTSGTTSRPKIVPLTHANICTSACSSGSALALSEADRCLNVLPLFHGHGLIATVLASLTAGASVVCTSGCDVNSFFAWLTSFRPTWYSAVPTMHKAILARARNNGERAADSRLRFVRSASAPLPPRVFTELERTFETFVIEFYGMTETASSPIACNPLPPRRQKPGSVGLRVDLDVAIVDDRGALLPNGRAGQVLVRGASVMPGYDGDPLAARAAFASDWFETGDQGFFDNDGYLFLVGRKQDIINTGGEKVAPREVEEVLQEHPAVAEAAAFAVPHVTLGEDVMCAVVLQPNAAATAKEIRQFVIGRIAEFKVPREVLIVSELPKGPTGKIQRAALALQLGLTTVRKTFVAPRTRLEKMLARCWAEILQLEQVGIHDDFFALGGDSLLAASVLSQICDITHIELEVSRLFEAPTVAEMAQHLENLIQGGHHHRSSAIRRAPREHGMPASVTQERLWKLQQRLRGLPFFNVLYGIRLTPPFDLVVLERSINEIARRHEILRTTFAVLDNRLVQVIAPHLTVPLVFDDLHTSPKSKNGISIAHRLVQKEALHSFDLAHGPLFRVRLMRLAEQEYLLLVTTHQVITDGWSLGVLVNELAALYNAFSARKASPLAPLPIQYADFAHWQRQWSSDPDRIAQLEYWRDQLRDPLPVMRLGKATARRTIDVLSTARRPLALPASLCEAAKRFSHREGGTLFMALLAALKTLLHCYLGHEDLLVATNVANRNRPGTDGLIGPLANTVILRTSLDGNPSSQEVMRRVRATTLAAFGQQDLPFEDLAQTLEHDRAIKPAALAQFMLLLQNATLRPVATLKPSLRYEEAAASMLLPLVTATTFDAILMLRESRNGLVGTCVYKPHLFGVKTIDRFIRDFQKVLEQMVAKPELPISAIRLT
jgi:acyl-CoA synthetase (AMP-forming)/AMP-acid ligase II